MSYFIRPILPTIGEWQKIDEAEYTEIIQARKLVWDVLLVKEFFSDIVRNFLLLENKVNKIEIAEVKIGFTVNAEKVFGQLIAKQIKQTEKSSILEDFKSYLQERSNYYSEGELNKDPKYLNIRQLIKEYIALLEKLNQEVNEKLNSKFQEAKTTLSQKVEYYCHDNSPESAFEIYKQNQENGNLERLDVSLSLFQSWEEVIKKYSNLGLAAS